MRSLLASLTARIDRSATAWRVRPAVARMIFWLPIAGALLLIPLRVFAEPAYRFILAEDGPVETVGFLCFAIATVAAGASAARLARGGATAAAILLGLGAVGLVFVTGEEIAWGQRMFGIVTPERLAAVNKQNELTLHNISVVQYPLTFAMLLVGAWGAAMSLLVAAPCPSHEEPRIVSLIIPPFFDSGAFAVTFVYRLMRYTVWRPSGFSVTKYAEWIEMSLGFGICVFLLLVYRRLARPRPERPLTAMAALGLQAAVVRSEEPR